VPRIASRAGPAGSSPSWPRTLILRRAGRDCSSASTQNLTNRSGRTWHFHADGECCLAVERGPVQPAPGQNFFLGALFAGQVARCLNCPRTTGCSRDGAGLYSSSITPSTTAAPARNSADAWVRHAGVRGLRAASFFFFRGPAPFGSQLRLCLQPRRRFNHRPGHRCAHRGAAIEMGGYRRALVRP